MASRTSLRVALCQMRVTADKAQNIARAVSMIGDAVTAHKADVVVLPECFNCPYGTKYFAKYAEVARDGPESPTVSAMGQAAKFHGITLVAGSIPEVVQRGEGTTPLLFNTSLTFDPSGQITGRHRKIHLFKINTEQVKFDESEVLTAGCTPTVIDIKKKDAEGEGQSAASTAAATAGIGICFDIRFPQLALHYMERQTDLLFYPGAFNMVTGPVHWHLAARSRAVDAQQFVALCSPARDTKAEYVAYGHSLIMDPWGEVVAEAKDGEQEEIVFGEVDLAKLAHFRARLPINAGTRSDLYALTWNRDAKEADAA